MIGILEILSIGSGLSLQDAGRTGWRRFGVPSGGAMDQRSMALANTLLGNPREAPILEIAQQGVRLKVLQDVWVAVAGADFCGALPSGTAIPIRAGEVLSFDQKAAGLYAYLAVPGGFHSAKWLGSAATDLRNGMGQGLKKGDYLEAQLLLPSVSIRSIVRRISTEAQDHIQAHAAHFKLYPGPQHDTFSVQVRQQFIQNSWTVSAQSDRTGYRLEGEPLQVPKSIPSEPVLPGSFQVPGSGQPIITMVDGPTVGGYAKIAVLPASDLARLAQCAPGTNLTFSWLD